MSVPRAKRVLYTFPISLQGRAVALSTDVSKEGFCLESSTYLAPGAEVKGVVRHGTLKLPFTGRVAWAQAGDPRASTWHKVGVRFEHVSVGLKALLGVKVH